MMMMMTMKTFALACAVLLLARGAHAQPGQDDPCLTEGEALDACMTTAGLGDAAQGVCDTCVDLAASATYTIGTITCDELASGDNGLCTALNLCPCPAECAAEAGSYALCEINAELGLGCESIDCPPPQGTDAPPAVTDVPPEGTDPTAPPSVEGVDACLTEDEALDACMIREGTGDADKEECDICVGAAAAATYAIMTTSCDELAMTDNGLCVALGLCRTCPVGCSTEMNAYALCEVNDELGLGCETLECNVADGAATDTPPEGTDTPPTGDTETPTTAPAPTEAASTPTEAAPTEAAITPTEAPPTDTPTSMASPASFTKIGVLVAGFLAVVATAI